MCDIVDPDGLAHGYTEEDDKLHDEAPDPLVNNPEQHYVCNKCSDDFYVPRPDPGWEHICPKCGEAGDYTLAAEEGCDCDVCQPTLYRAK